MKGGYYTNNTLPRDYFDDLFEKVFASLKKDGNVCVAAVDGGGGKTFYNYFLKKASEKKFFRNISSYDPEVEKDNITTFVNENLKPNGRTLFIFRYFQRENNKKGVLESLASIKYLHSGKVNYLVFTDQTLLTQPNSYIAQSTAFFLDRFYIQPFDFKKSSEMIKLNCDFYGWEVKPSIYRRIHELSGGIPRLNKYIAKVIAESPEGKVSQEKMLLNPNIYFQLDQYNKLLLELSKENLILIGLTDEKGKIKSALLKKYFENYQNDVLKSLLPRLSPFERRFLTFFYERKGEIVSIDKIGDLYEMAGREFSPWATYKLISRLRPKIKKFFKLESVKGQGYLLKSV
jgi:hypothetical protein